MNKPRRILDTSGNPRANEYFDFKRKSKDQSPTNALTEQVMEYIQASGGAARRVNVQGRYVEGETYIDALGRTRLTKGSWIPSGMLPGFEDVDAIKMCRNPNPYALRQFIGVKVAVEIKRGKDQHREAQKKRQAEVEAAGGVYILARELEQFKLEWDAITLY